jgi:hypothetical protein
MFFASDNTSGVPDAILTALTRANAGFSLGYGADTLMAQVRARLREVFEAPEAAVYLVATGTAANRSIINLTVTDSNNGNNSGDNERFESDPCTILQSRCCPHQNGRINFHLCFWTYKKVVFQTAFTAPSNLNPRGKLICFPNQ